MGTSYAYLDRILIHVRMYLYPLLYLEREDMSTRCACC